MIQFNNKPPKKLVVKNLRNKSKIPVEYEAAALARISSTIDSVFKDEALPYGHEEIYRNCETLCKFHLANSVYTILYEKCESEAIRRAETLAKDCDGILDEVEYLKKFDKVWSDFQRHYNLIESLFLYLDKVYITQQQKSTPNNTISNSLIHIKRFGINFFRAYSLMNTTNSSILGKEMINKLLNLVDTIRRNLIREGETYELTRRIISMLRDLEEYSQGQLEFEKVFIQNTCKYYEEESLKRIKELSLPNYLKYSWDRLNYEGEIISELLAPITREKLMMCVRERIIKSRMSYLFPVPKGSSIRELFNASDFESLGLLYEMINGVFEVESLATEWTFFIRSHGQELMTRGNDYKTIEGIAKFKGEVDFIICECFQSDPILQGCLKDAFESVLNGRGDRSAELLALYIHQKFQFGILVGSDEATLEEIEKFMERVLLLFRYLHRKEAFDTFYKRTLAQRLLFNANANANGNGNKKEKDLSLERQFISKLRDECGGGFVSRMESMLKDVEQSLELTKSFKSAANSTLPEISSVTGINVISGLWPNCNLNESDWSMSMPTEILKLENSFSDFYSGQKKNCSLKWNERMGSCVMRSTFNSGRYELILTIPQALLLLRFNEKTDQSEKFQSKKKLIKEMNMKEEFFNEVLISLTGSLYPILIFDQSGTSLGVNEEFEYNGPPGSKIPLYVLQSPFLPVEEEIVGLIAGVGTCESSNNKNLNTLNIQDRQYQVDSMLVRRMKSQTRCLKKDLINYVLAHIGENVKISWEDVEARIGGLVEKEFMKISGESVIYLP